MHPNDLKEFRDNVAQPLMMELFEKTNIPDGTCYIDNIEISFLDGRNCGFESRIQASGMVYLNGKAQEYHYEDLDVETSDFFLEHQDCIFVTDGSLRVVDELDEMDLTARIRNLRECERIFHQFTCPDNLKMEMISIEYEKMKHLLSSETPKVILVEIDYKGEYGRYALTPDEFDKEFGPRLSEDMPTPGDDACTYTFRPMVHAWYQMTEVGSDLWNAFFTDMSWGLPESDIESGNLAYIDEDMMQSLKDHLPSVGDIVLSTNEQSYSAEEAPEITALRMEISNLRHELDGVVGYDREGELAISIAKQLLTRECQLCAALKGVQLDEERLDALLSSNALYDQIEETGSLEAWLDQNGLFRESLDAKMKSAHERVSTNKPNDSPSWEPEF